MTASPDSVQLLRLTIELASVSAAIDSRIKA
jgi:hypothetical protein